MRVRRIAALAALILAISISPAAAAFPGRNGKIVASRWKAVKGEKRPRWDIVVMNRNGNKLRQLTGSGKAFSPDVSPDGETVAYICDNYGYAGEICTKPISGGKEKVLRRALGYHKMGLTWSPDGKWIAYGHYESGDTARVYKIRKNGRDSTLVWEAEDESYVWGISGLSWSPDGETIAFENVNFDNQHHEIWGVGPDGSNFRPIVQDQKWSASPDYSPDGSRLMFSAYPDGEVSQILHIGAEGGDEQQVTSGSKDAYSPSFSPDGERLLFVRDGSLFKRNLDGSGLERIRSRTKRSGFGSTAWQPR